MRQAQKLSQKLSIPISTRPFFPGISDISFLGGRVTAHETQLLAANTPAWKTRARFNYTEVTNLGIPSVNIGPWGRDYHQRLERVYTPYAFEVLPEFLWLITQDLFGL
jgi:arginine utilization protein RocB